VVDLAESMPRIGDTLRRSLRGDIEVVVTIDAPSSRVKIDTAELELALLNLGVNARDAMPHGGTIALSLRLVQLDGEPEYDGLRGSFATIDMKDTGSGIAPDVLERIFEPFFTTKAVGEGTGLGLSQVYGFAKQSGGTAVVRSKVGRGTSVSIYLPLSQEIVTTVGANDFLDVSGAAGGPVLLVEDAPDVAAVIVDYLQEMGYVVEQVRDATEALKRLQEDPSYNLLLSDVLMPGPLGGLELARLVRERMPHIPIVLSTGYSEKIQDAIGAGFTILKKPYGVSELQVAVTEALNDQNRVTSRCRMEAAE
jgi:two-component system NtrC family sensor kinase